MNGLEGSRMWRNLKQHLGLKGMGCCGAIWSLGTCTLTIMQQEEEEEDPHMQTQQRTSASGMNLAMALQAERNLRGGDNVGRNKNVGPGVKTLMMLIEDDEDWKKKKTDVVGEEGNDWKCCVCMERNKGAAFIPCGHTFCRVCSKEMWLNHGSCSICSHSILQILDIF